MRVLKTLALSLTLALAAGANAASLTLVYTGDNAVSDDGTIAAAVGDLITLDLIMDFSDQPVLGGGFDIVFDAVAFEFVEYVRSDLGDFQFGRSPDVEDGRLVSGAFGAFGGLSGPDLVASITFRLLAAPPGQYGITPDATSGIAGPFVSTDFTSVVEPDFFGVSVGMQPVPVPAAVWLLGSGLLALFGVRRRGT